MALQHVPGHAFAAGWSGQGALERVIAQIPGKKVFRVDSDRAHLRGLLFFRRHTLPERVEKAVGGALFEENRDDGEMSVRVSVYEVGDQIVFLAVDLFFGGMMKVKLLQGVGLVTHSQRAAFWVVDLHRVAVINDVQGYAAV